MSASYECFVLSGRTSASERSLVQRIPTKCRVSKECDLETTTMRRPRPIRVGETQERRKSVSQKEFCILTVTSSEDSYQVSCAQGV
jgi:hypothetical protein